MTEDEFLLSIGRCWNKAPKGVFDFQAAKALLKKFKEPKKSTPKNVKKKTTKRATK